MKRRELLVFAGSAAAWPLVAQAQQRDKVYRVGILEPVPAAQNAANLDALRLGLRSLGYNEGQTWSSSIGRPMLASRHSRISHPSWFV